MNQKRKYFDSFDPQDNSSRKRPFHGQGHGHGHGRYNDRPGNSQMDHKTFKLVSAVQNQGPLGRVILMQTENESSYVILQNALSNANIPLNVIKNTEKDGEFILKIGEEEYERGHFENIQAARAGLAEKTLTTLKARCFFIQKRKIYTDVSNAEIFGDESKAAQSAPKSLDAGSKALKMMEKMGWTGGGLGAQEQGRQEAVTLVENISRQGLGSRNIVGEISKILQDFSKSTKLTTMAFDSEFTKEERELIHKLARKYGLKSKSEGKDEARRITVSKKLSRYDLVKELLKIGGENEIYKLKVPSNFIHLM